MWSYTKSWVVCAVEATWRPTRGLKALGIGMKTRQALFRGYLSTAPPGELVLRTAAAMLMPSATRLMATWTSGLIDIQPNMQYDLYAYVRGEIDGDDSAGSWIIRAYYCDSNGNYIGYYQDAASGGAGSLTNSWQYKGGRITTPANAAKLRIQLYDYMNSGWVAYDDISLKEVENYHLTYDAENRLVSVSGGTSATFYYDGDGNRVKGTIGGITTTYIGNPSVPSGQGYFEWTGSTSTMKKYYYAGASRVAMRTGPTTIEYLLSDHLGSQAITANSSGVMSAEIRYFPWGTERYTSGTTPTTYHFTGQRLESMIGLYFYNSRWYDPEAGRFVQADTMIPQGQGVQGWDRYAYVNNNPVKYADPSGHDLEQIIFNKRGELPKETRRPQSTSGTLPTSTPAPLFHGSLIPLTPQQQMTQFAIWESSPTQSVVTQCPVPPTAKGMETTELLAFLREITGEIDPVIPGPLAGTNISYMDAVNKAAEIINTRSPGNPYSKYLTTFAIIAPPVSTAYNFIYDKSTNTGEYSNISITELTPSQIAYLITGLTIVTPAIIINFIK